MPEKLIFTIPEELSDDEKKRFIEHFYGLGYIANKHTYWDYIINKEYGDSFFATIYTLVHPSRKPLNTIIRDQFQSLTDFTKRAFQYVCCFHQFNVPMNMELLVRSLRCSWQDFRTEVMQKDAEKVLFEEIDDSGTIFYRTHHRIIAQKTVEYFFGDAKAQKEIFLDIFNNALMGNVPEHEICEKILIRHIGPNATYQRFSHEQQREIFRCVCEKEPVRALWHHWGLIEKDDLQLDEAERILNRALEIPKDSMESYRANRTKIF